MNKHSIGGMSLDGMDAEQLAVVERLARKAEQQYDLAAMFGSANQCMVLRSRAREALQAIHEAQAEKC